MNRDLEKTLRKKPNKNVGRNIRKIKSIRNMRRKIDRKNREIKKIYK